MSLTIKDVPATTVQNLRDLSAYLKALPETNVTFDMATFYDDNTTSAELERLGECGTSACAVGHYAMMRGWTSSHGGVKPPVGVAIKHGLVRADGGAYPIGWSEFCTKEIGVEAINDGEDELFEWLFDAYWGRIDNTPEGAAARIDYFLEKGLPSNFHWDALRWGEPIAHQWVKDYAQFLPKTTGEV